MYMDSISILDCCIIIKYIRGSISCFCHEYQKPIISHVHVPSPVVYYTTSVSRGPCVATVLHLLLLFLLLLRSMLPVSGNQSKI